MEAWSQPRPYGFDDDPPPRRERPAGAMLGVTWGQTLAAVRASRRVQAETERASWPAWRCRGYAKREEAARSQQERRKLRNLVVILCRDRGGMSWQEIALAMGLSRSAVGKILHEWEQGVI